METAPRFAVHQRVRLIFRDTQVLQDPCVLMRSQRW